MTLEPNEGSERLSDIAEDLLVVLEGRVSYAQELLRLLNKNRPAILGKVIGPNIYPLLHRLNERGLLISNWGEGLTRERLYYTVTDKGIELLRQVQKYRQQLAKREN